MATGIADVVGMPGAHTQACTIPQLRERVREVIALVHDLDDDDLDFFLDERFVGPPAIVEAWQTVRHAVSWRRRSRPTRPS